MPTYDGARFAVSGLPRAQQANALDGEIMVDHTTGLYLLKTTGGQTMSIDTIARQRLAMNTLGTNVRLFGNRQMNIYDMQLTHLKCPAWVTTAQSFLTDKSTGTDVLWEKALPTGANEMMFYIDADALAVNTNNELSVQDTLTATVVLSIVYTNASSALVTVPYTLTGSIKNINSTMVFIEEIIPAQFLASSVTTLKSVTLTAAAPQKILLHGLLLAIK